jgi:hypothetical protein
MEVLSFEVTFVHNKEWLMCQKSGLRDGIRAFKAIHVLVGAALAVFYQSSAGAAEPVKTFEDKGPAAVRQVFFVDDGKTLVCNTRELNKGVTVHRS